MTVLTTDQLDLASMPPGEVTHRWLRIVDDGLGRPICVPVMVAKGVLDGPVVALTAAVHGNELNGIPVIHRLFERLDPEKLAGTVIGVPVVNVPAYHRHQRLTMEGFDLNHEFPGRADGHMAAVYAHRFLERVALQANAVIDFHTASGGRVNCLYVRADLNEPRVKQMAYLQRPEMIVHNPPNDATLRGACDERGVDAITVEIGNPNRFQNRLIDRALIGVRAVLGEHGMLPRRRLIPGDPPIVCERSYWLYTDDGGLLEVFPKVLDKVGQGEPVARLVDAFGRTLKTYHAPESGFVIGHSVDPVATTGARILHLGIPAPDGSPLLESP